ncbi:hypothetical protein A0O34_21675 [Chryseobacterium glaciei]|uniref:Uncharacterized protein n=1 Tax=Chryseobacterium glaciei TaxID=1685010 RepID=A0A172Y136_9FLAO|nr:hypothetical protein [Chryseobacterium glaciei]ANF52973.1 hypothetical protein A0O34_21675 [Chryseobacterium glaciei]
MNKNLKPAAIFLLDNESLPRYGIFWEKNTLNKVCRLLKFEYSNNKVYKLSSVEKDKLDIFSIKISELRNFFDKIKSNNVEFIEKTEMPGQFYRTPLWEISW